MARAGFSILAGVACIMGAVARPLAAQRLPSHDSLRAMAHRALSASASDHECPMPVAIPDLTRVERMPVAPADARGHYIQVVPPGCVNPLFHQPRSLLSPPLPLGPADTLPRLRLPFTRRDTLPALRFPFPVADSIPGLRLPLHPPPR
jgi:hypothetical protein